MTDPFRKARQQARATGQAKIGRCVIAEMAAPWRGRKRQGVELLAAIRLREIEKIIRQRHGNIIDDASDTDDMDVFRGYVMAVGGSLSEVRGWARRWMPWFSEIDIFIEAESLGAKLASGKRGARILPADAVAKLMFVSSKERAALSLTTIGACDVTKEAREKTARERKRERDRERQRARRQAEERTPRHEYLATSAEANRPWEVAGVSRRTWYRQKGGTGPSRAILISKGGDTLVPRSDMPFPSSSIEILSAEREREGFGDQSPAVFQEAEPHGAIYVRSVSYG